MIVKFLDRVISFASETFLRIYEDFHAIWLTACGFLFGHSGFRVSFAKADRNLRDINVVPILKLLYSHTYLFHRNFDDSGIFNSALYNDIHLHNLPFYKARP